MSRGGEETRVGERGGGKVFCGMLSLHEEAMEFERGSGEDLATSGGLGRPGRAGGREEGGARGEGREDGGLEVAVETSEVSGAPVRGLETKKEKLLEEMGVRKEEFCSLSGTKTCKVESDFECGGNKCRCGRSSCRSGRSCSSVILI